MRQVSRVKYFTHKLLYFIWAENAIGKGAENVAAMPLFGSIKGINFTNEVRNSDIQSRCHHRGGQIHPQTVQRGSVRTPEGETGEEDSGGDPGGECETGREETDPEAERELPSGRPPHHPDL